MNSSSWSKRERLLAAISTVLFIAVVVCLFLLIRTPDQEAQFLYLNPAIARMNVDKFLSQQAYYQLDYFSMREKLTSSTKQVNATVALYYEDLNTGAWVGVNEKEKFIPGSLLKVPALIGIMKKIEDGVLTLNQPVSLLPEDIDYAFGPLGERGAGTTLTIMELMNYSAYYSDNTANLALRRQLEYGEFADAMLGSGIPYTTDIRNNIMPVSVKDYSNIFRSLYHSSQLRRSSSELILSLLANTNFNTGLPAGVPASIPVSHKIGSWTDGQYHHDCGIVYLTNRPYILCVMTKGLDTQEAFSVIRELSREVYLEISAKNS